MHRHPSPASVLLRRSVPLCALIAAPLALAEPFWPQFQRDPQHTGQVPLIGTAKSVHVAWFTQIDEPTSGEQHATPVLAPDNSRLYVGGAGAQLTAVDLATGEIAWQHVLGDGTGVIHHAPVVAPDGALFVGCWNDTAPDAGFYKVIDEGETARVAWTFPTRRILGSPTRTGSGLVIVGGQDQFDTWSYFGLRDLGETYELAWTAATLADPNDPGSTGRVMSPPALSADETVVYGASFENETFWQIDAETGLELAALPLDAYAYAAAPVVHDGYVFMAEGLDFIDPDPATEGELYVLDHDETGVVQVLDSLPLDAGHLNGGSGAVYTRPEGTARIFVPANGFGESLANVIAVDFDPAAPDGERLAVAWTRAIGPAVWAYPQSIVTRDGVVYVIGPAEHKLYAIADGRSASRLLWSVTLANITQAEAWFPSATGPQGVIVGPDGTVYWHAVDGYLYALRGDRRGDLDNNGVVDADDAGWLADALLAPDDFALRLPEVDALTRGDLTADGRLDFFDMNRLLDLLPPE